MSKEPDFVRHISDRMRAAKDNGEGNDAETAVRIWADFKWFCKSADRTHQEIADRLQVCIDQCAKIKNTIMRVECIRRFEILKKRVEEFILAPTEEGEAICPRCNLKLFLCPCSKKG